jgi:hypothetical protein
MIVRWDWDLSLAVWGTWSAKDTFVRPGSLLGTIRMHIIIEKSSFLSRFRFRARPEQQLKQTTEGHPFL